ncbi:MAG: aconitase X [Nitrososphaeria archaeon]
MNKLDKANDTAQRIIRALSRFYKSDMRIRIRTAHISGVSYENIGDAGLLFLEDIAEKGKFSVYTTVNPMGADIYDNTFNLHEQFIKKQEEIAKAYLKMGAIESFTCTPYDYFLVPKKGSHVAWAESSAVVYGNSFLELYTNKESALSALASAILGETIYSGMHIEENRKCTYSYKYKNKINELILGLIVYHIGKETERPFNIKLGKRLSSLEKKALSAALGTIGNVAMLKIGDRKGISKEVLKKDLEKEYLELNTSEDGEIIILGCPHWNHKEIINLLEKMYGRCFKKDCIIACCKKAYESTIKIYDRKLLNKKRIYFFKGACPIFSPLLKEIGVSKVITNSVKAAHYYKYRGIKVNLRELNSIIETESE